MKKLFHDFNKDNPYVTITKAQYIELENLQRDMTRLSLLFDIIRIIFFVCSIILPFIKLQLISIPIIILITLINSFRNKIKVLSDDTGQHVRDAFYTNKYYQVYVNNEEILKLIQKINYCKGMVMQFQNQILLEFMGVILICILIFICSILL